MPAASRSAARRRSPASAGEPCLEGRDHARPPYRAWGTRDRHNGYTGSLGHLPQTTGGSRARAILCDGRSKPPDLARSLIPKGPAPCPTRAGCVDIIDVEGRQADGVGGRARFTKSSKDQCQPILPPATWSIAFPQRAASRSPKSWTGKYRLHPRRIAGIWAAATTSILARLQWQRHRLMNHPGGRREHKDRGIANYACSFDTRVSG